MRVYSRAQLKNKDPKVIMPVEKGPLSSPRSHSGLFPALEVASLYLKFLQ